MKGLPLELRLVANTNTSTAVYALTDDVPAGEVWEFDFSAIYNTSAESVTAQWCIARGTDITLVSADQTVADGKAVATNQLPKVCAGEQFGAKLAGSAKKGPVAVVLSGWRRAVAGGNDA